MMFGDYFSYDTPYAVKLYMREIFPEYTLLEFNYMFATLYAVYDFPNIILPLINGYLGSKFGIRRMMTIFLGFILAGSCLFTYGVATSDFAIMLIGRIVYGMGGDSLLVTLIAYISEVFNKDRIGLALGIFHMFTGISESANLYFSPKLVESYGIESAFYLTTVLCLLTFLGRFLLAYIEKKYQMIKDTLTESTVQVNLLPTKEDLQFPEIFYTLLWGGVPTMLSYYGFFYLAYDFLPEVWFADESVDDAQNGAAFYASLSTLTKTFGLITFGYIADKYKIHKHFGIAASFTLATAYFLCLFMPPFIPFFLDGLGAAMGQVALWSCLSFVLDEKKLLVGAAVLWSLINGAFALILYWNTFSYQITGGYHLAIFSYILLNMCALPGGFKFFKNMKYKEEENLTV